ncbi:helix-turn-helix domain-containing protein [Streptomyces sp. Tue6028]|uniref:PucR family transcriptional regulator n=1 Tax=Streptomyces sp. Tue6028 TaxID=2036037 RepID=UPI003D75008F
MLTLETLVRALPGLHLSADGEGFAARSRRVTGIWPAGELVREPIASHIPPGCLMLTSTDAPWLHDLSRCDQAVRSLVHLRAAALVVLPSDRDNNGAGEPHLALLAQAASRYELPLLFLAPNVTPTALFEVVRRMAGADTKEAETKYLQALLNHLRSPRPADELGTGALLDHIGRLVDGHAAVIAPDGRLVTTSGEVMKNLVDGTCAAPITRVRKGSVGAASVSQNGYFIQLMGVGSAPPRPVLAVARRAPYSSGMSALLSYTTTALAVQERLARADSVDRQLTEALRLSRLAIFQQLMTGDVHAARRSAEPLLPGLLDTDYVQVYLVDGPDHERSTALRACEQDLGNSALIVQCPVYETQLIVVVPTGADQGNSRVRSRLRHVIAARSRYFLGESRPVRLGRLPDAYQGATQALAVARYLPDHSATQNGERQLAYLVDDTASLWARELLKPLEPLADDDRRELTATLRHSLQFGQSGAARLLGVNRKTVSTRCKRAAQLLGFDQEDLQSRALLHFVLEVAQRPAQGWGLMSAPDLAEVLASPAAQSWARKLIDPLHEDGRSLLTSLRAWIACNGHVSACSEQLGLHPNTIRNHLSACEQLLGRKLLSNAGGVHDLVLALEILEDSAVDLAHRIARLSAAGINESADSERTLVTGM